MTKVAVVQPLPGIGDMIWHLAHIRAIAAHVGAPVTLIAKPRSAADQIFSGEDTLRDVIWLDRNPDQGDGRHDGAGGFRRMATALRARRFDAVYLLHHSKSLAALVWAAGIPARFGYGAGVQRLFLNRPPYLSASDQRLTPIEQATRWLQLAAIPCPDTEPRLSIAATAREAVAARVPGPYVVIGIGTSEPYKQWGGPRFAALAEALVEAGWQSVVLVGGRGEAELARDITARAPAIAQRIVTAAGWHLAEVIALCGGAGFYVGNDTGVMNIAAAAGPVAYGLFGATPPLSHSPRIVGIEPPGGRDKDSGMARISLSAVVDTIRASRGTLGPL